MERRQVRDLREDFAAQDAHLVRMYRAHRSLQTANMHAIRTIIGEAVARRPSPAREDAIRRILMIARFKRRHDQAARLPAHMPQRFSGIAARLQQVLPRGLAAGQAFAFSAMAAAAAIVIAVNCLPWDPHSDAAGVNSSVASVAAPLTARAPDAARFIVHQTQPVYGFSPVGVTADSQAFRFGVSAVDLAVAFASRDIELLRAVVAEIRTHAQRAALTEVVADADYMLERVSGRDTQVDNVHRLMKRMDARFGAGELTAAYALGRWVEAVYLATELALAHGDHALFADVLRNGDSLRRD
ncbi:MAG: hypothetical protein ACR2RB_11705, partial [Gammaproteobacteria bacterium]